jgi:hypothetical protein
MDYVTRQFINLAKKFRKELPKFAKLIHRDIEQHIKALRAQDKSRKDEKDIQPVWFEKIVSEYQQSEQNKSAQGQRHYRVQNSIRWATWCAFGAAFVYAAISAWQTCEIRRNFRTDQRAWIKVSSEPPELTATDTPVFWIAHFANVGKTPAFKIHGEFQYQFLRKDESPDFSYSAFPVTHARSTTLFAGEQLPDPIKVIRASYRQGSHERIDLGISAAELQLIKRGEAWIAKNGRLTYEDVFGKQHTTTFCSYSTLRDLDIREVFESPGVHVCANYNSVDNN